MEGRNRRPTSKSLYSSSGTTVVHGAMKIARFCLDRPWGLEAMVVHYTLYDDDDGNKVKVQDY